MCKRPFILWLGRGWVTSLLMKCGGLLKVQPREKLCSSLVLEYINFHYWEIICLSVLTKRRTRGRASVVRVATGKQQPAPCNQRHHSKLCTVVWGQLQARHIAMATFLSGTGKTRHLVGWCAGIHSFHVWDSALGSVNVAHYIAHIHNI